jgi:hypothetical protein
MPVRTTVRVGQARRDGSDIFQPRPPQMDFSGLEMLGSLCQSTPSFAALIRKVEAVYPMCDYGLQSGVMLGVWLGAHG